MGEQQEGNALDARRRARARQYGADEELTVRFHALVDALDAVLDDDEELLVAFSTLEDALFRRGLIAPLMVGSVEEIIGGPHDGAYLLTPQEPADDDGGRDDS